MQLDFHCAHIQIKCVLFTYNRLLHMLEFPRVSVHVYCAVKHTQTPFLLISLQHESLQKWKPKLGLWEEKAPLLLTARINEYMELI